MEWIKCKDKLPPNPKCYKEVKDYLCIDENGIVSYTSYADGFNNFISILDGTICRESQFDDVVAWMEVPDYKEDK